jgi:hypothetical protein
MPVADLAGGTFQMLHSFFEDPELLLLAIENAATAMQASAPATVVSAEALLHRVLGAARIWRTLTGHTADVSAIS